MLTVAGGRACGQRAVTKKPRMDGAYADETDMEADEVIDEVLQLLNSSDPPRTGSRALA